MTRKKEKRSLPLNAYITKCFSVDRVLEKTLEKLAVVFVEELLKLDMYEVMKVKGIGPKRLKDLERLIRAAKRGTNSPELDFKQIRKNRLKKVASTAMQLPYIPSLLRNQFESEGIVSLRDLLSLDLLRVQNDRHWGAKKCEMLQALQEFYLRLYADKDVTAGSIIGSLMATCILPTQAIRNYSIQQFVDLNCLRIELEGKARKQAEDLLRFFIMHFGLSPKDVVSESLSSVQWRDIPLRVSFRVKQLLDQYELKTVGELAQLVATRQVVCPLTAEVLPISELSNFGEVSLLSLSQELSSLSELGVTKYRYRKADSFADANELVTHMLGTLDARRAEIMTYRSQGYSLEKISLQVGLTRERVRQLLVLAADELSVFKDVATELLKPLIDKCEEELFIESLDAAKLVGASEPWVVTCITRIADCTVKELRPGILSKYDKGFLKRVLDVKAT